MDRPAAVLELDWLAVREEVGEVSLDAVSITSHQELAPQAWQSTVSHVDGRLWTVRVLHHPALTATLL